MSKIKKAVPRIIGTGLVALDVVLNGNPLTAPRFFVGGSCGNVLTILSYLGWEALPVARFADNTAARRVFEDLKKWGVKTDLVTKVDGGSTPIIIHRITKDKKGNPKHRFEFKDPDTGKWLPTFKPFLARSVADVITHKEVCDVFYFDRISRAAIDLAKHYKKAGALIYFEPSSMGSSKKSFSECLALADIIKFSSDRIPEYKNLFPSSQVPLEIETLGANGLAYRFSRDADVGNWKHLPAPDIEQKVVDTAGAGDWCSAGIILKICSAPAPLNLMNTDLIIDCLNFGQILGALNCRFEGARGLMYNIDESSLMEITKSVQKRENVVLTIQQVKKEEIEKPFLISELQY